MNNGKLKNIKNTIMQRDPTLIDRWPLLVQPWDEGILTGVVFEKIRKEYAVWIFAQPLYIPFEHIAFIHGKRLRNNGIEIRLTLEDEPIKLLGALEKEGAFERFRLARHPNGLIDWLQYEPHEASFTWLEALSYTLLWCGRTKEALPVLEILAKNVQIAGSNAWQIEARKRVSQLSADAIKDPDLAMERLSGWRAYTLKNLKFPEHSQDR